MIESAHRFGSGDSLVGVLARPEEAATRGRTAVITLNAGFVHKIGPSRVYVALARQLAARGLPVLRFDFSMNGDSGTRSDLVPFREACVEEAGEAMDFVEAITGCTRFVLIGFCLGGDAVLRVARADTRVSGVVAVNALSFGLDPHLYPRVRVRALARHHRRVVLRERFRWSALVRAIGLHVKVLLPRPRIRAEDTPFPALLERGVPIHLLHSEADEGLDHLHSIERSSLAELRRQGQFHLDVVPGADHAVSERRSQGQVLEAIHACVDAVERRERGS